MQNFTLPIQVSPTANAPVPSRDTAQPNKDAPAFSQTLNREMAQRQNKPVEKTPEAPVTPIKVGPGHEPAPAPAPAPAAPVAPTGPVRAIKHIANVDNATVDAGAAGTAAAVPADDAATLVVATDPALLATDATATASAAAAAAEAGAAAAAPMSDMLAMVASYKQLMRGGAPAAKPEATSTADATAATKTVRGTSIADDTHTLAALQNTLKKTDGAATTKGATAQLDDNAATPAVSRTAPGLAAATKAAAPQSDAALSTLRDAAVTATVKDTAPLNTTGSAFQAQLSSVEMVQTAVTQGSDRIPARLGTTAWDNQVSQKVVWMVAGADQSATLTLNPPDLGPVQVVLNVNNDQATVAFSSATPEVREALENAMPRLREMLSDAGVTLGDASVSANLPDQRQADTNNGNGNRSGNGNNNGNDNGTGIRRGETDIPLPRSASRAVRDDGVVDTFA